MKINASYQINVHLPVDTGADMDRVTSERGWTPTRYARQAVLDQLARDIKQQGAPVPADRHDTIEQQS